MRNGGTEPATGWPKRLGGVTSLTSWVPARVRRPAGSSGGRRERAPYVRTARQVKGVARGLAKGGYGPSGGVPLSTHNRSGCEGAAYEHAGAPLRKLCHVERTRGRTWR
ncbi:hypothetical protein GCM10022244_27640 [Streptomyces gulbargensis]|uniref:Uncharacterized protein n=1 Tax=Streptomyces gulbargensis TaxID=364901 RepID=A0ABP7M7R9_9ACTN